jgi:hypothetical protein
MSFPGFLPGVIAKFVNASTVDGFNPYRITSDGIDWETVDPDDPWSYIGYWGDHQIIYLLKFLESLPRFYPGMLEGMLSREIFSYANVPYHIKPYGQILEDPDSTIVFDAERASRIEGRGSSVGSDGKLVSGLDGKVYHVSLLEKLLVPALSKLSNCVPDGGIWMNTQRPEWNDANNALVGNGISMVTLYYMRRYMRFIADLLGGMEEVRIPVSIEVSDWLERLHAILHGESSLLNRGKIDDGERKRLLDLLGKAFSEYRDRVYSDGFSGKREIDTGRIVRFCEGALEWLDHAISANRRDDGLYHSYNLLEISKAGDKASLSRLYEMLEGQVAALSSGAIGHEETALLLGALFASAMYREDQNSFMLYPERELPSFLNKNRIPGKKVKSTRLLSELSEEGESSIISLDAAGVYRFNGDFANAEDLASALDRLSDNERWTQSVSNDRQAVIDIFEEVFDHKSFTGRSGTMYGYEGLGCIYWHMVSKLLLAVQEIILSAAGDEKESRYLETLADFYFRVRSGLCFEKTVGEYGAFPTDPYSHTPPHAGAKQPGMTGQVKEEILTRFGELGVIVDNGTVRLHPVLLRRAEFFDEESTFHYYDIFGEKRSIDMPAGALAFTFCQVPVIYSITSGEAQIGVTIAGGEAFSLDGDSLDRELSSALFGRRGHILRIDAFIPEKLLR